MAIYIFIIVCKIIQKIFFGPLRAIEIEVYILYLFYSYMNVYSMYRKNNINYVSIYFIIYNIIIRTNFNSIYMKNHGTQLQNYVWHLPFLEVNLV